LHFAPLLLIIACELLLLIIERLTPLPGWLHLGISISLAVVLLAFAALFKTRQAQFVAGLRREIDGMQQEAAKAARRYKSLLEGAGSAIFIFDAESGVLEEENRVGRELLGFSREELTSMPARDLLHPCEHDRFRSFLYQLKRHGRAEMEDLQFQRKDGSLFLGEINARLIDLGDEQVAHCLLRDITEKRRTEREIWQRNRELFILNHILSGMGNSPEMEVQEATLVEIMELFDAGGGALHLFDADGVTPRLCIAREVSQQLGQTISDKIAREPEAYRQLCVRGEDQGGLLSLAAAAEGWNCLTSIPIAAQQHVIGVMHLMHSGMHCYTKEELRFLTTVGKQMGSIIEKGRLFVELNWKSEELLRSHRLLEKSSHNLSVSESRLKQNLVLVEQANLELNRLDRMKNQFLGMVSHEFNTPLTSIIAGVDHLLQHGWSSIESAVGVLEMVRDGGLRLKALVADLLKLVRLEARRGGLETTAIHLRMFMENLLDQLQPVLEERGQVVMLRNLDSLPYFDGDRTYLERVFSELLLNAIRFTPKGGEIVVSGQVVDGKALQVRRDTLERFNPEFLRRCGERCYMEIEVRDQGIGIPPDEQRRIFEIFYEVGDIRHHTSGGTRAQAKGAGIGLAIVKGMVEAHGGMVWVESAGGSSFFLVLPLEQEAMQPELF